MKLFNFMWIAVIMAAVLSSCASWRPSLNTNVNYQRDLKFTVKFWNGKEFTDEKKFTGFGVVKSASKYEITVYALGDVDMITGTTCHREWKNANPKQSWWKDGVTFEFTPVKDMETNRNCPLDIGIYEKDKGRHGWALIEFEDKTMKLNSTVKCNGSETKFNGVSVCQAKDGLAQKIIFDEMVDFETIRGCEIKRSTDYKNFEYLMPPGDCSVHFCAFYDSDRCHRHTMFGYQIIPIRGIKK